MFLYQHLLASRMRGFELSMHNPKQTQEATLKRICHLMANTEYGRRMGITSKVSMSEFQSRVPIVDYEKLERWVLRQTATLDAVLCPPRLRTFEATSGSSGHRKLIPYNGAHLKTFENMFVLWSLDVLRSGLQLESGRFFFLISPKATAPNQLPNGVSVGFEDDSEYLGRGLRQIMNRFFVQAPELSHSENYLFRLAQTLLREEGLEVISVWSPSLLVLVAEYIASERKSLAAMPELSPLVRGILSSPDAPLTWLWPKLKLISCWQDGAARADAGKLEVLFPNAKVQGKGLLATEGAMTLPWSQSSGCVPLIQDLFFEFEDEVTGQVYPLWDLREGMTYQILFSAPNGFLRYRIGDRVKVGQLYEQTPTLEFVGRTEDISDLVGEKLSTAFVNSILEPHMAAIGFALLVPSQQGRQSHYELLICTDLSLPLKQNLARKVEEDLLTQHHYAVARRMGQLGAVSVRHIPDLRDRYYKSCLDHGISYGQIKNRGVIGDFAITSALLACEEPSLKSSRLDEAFSCPV